MSTKRSRIEATAGNALSPFLIMAKADRPGFYVENNTTVVLSLYIGEDTNPDGTSVIDGAFLFKTLTMQPGALYESPPWLRSQQIKGKFTSADAGKFIHITEIF